jgi:hypothetical protein
MDKEPNKQNKVRVAISQEVERVEKERSLHLQIK